MTSTDAQKIEEFLTRGVQEIFPSRAFLEEQLTRGRRLTMYLGIDPTGPSLHLGHAIALRKLAQFQSLGHRVILLIGDFTAMIGDPSGKSATRQMQTHKQALDHAKKYKKQAGKFLSFSGSNKAQVVYNSKWLAKLTLADVVRLASHMTVQQTLQRDMFKRRLEAQQDIHLHEFLYPLMQGYDSVALDVDGEIGGNDQMFNMLAGRKLLRQIKDKEKFVITMKLLTDSVGVKMGKTGGNMVTLEDTPVEMFGKIMSWTDDLIAPGFELLTDKPSFYYQGDPTRVTAGVGPRDLKAQLARSVVESLYSQKDANAASEQFDRTFKQHEPPEDVPEFHLKGKMSIMDVLVGSGLASSKTDARRLIEGGGVKVNGKVMNDFEKEVYADSLIQKGKRHFVRTV